MNEHPFEQSTHTGTGSPLTSSGEGIELRYSPLLRNIVTGAPVVAGIIAFIALSLRPDPSGVLGIIRFVVLLIDLLTAAFLWSFFSNYLVRADASGITHNTGFQRAFVPWQEIASFGMRQVGNGSPTVTLLDGQGQPLLKFNCVGAEQERERFLDFLDNKMSEE